MEPIDDDISVRFEYDIYSYLGNNSKLTKTIRVKLPDKFINVIKTMLPEIENISVTNSYTFKPAGYYGITPKETTLVNVKLQIEVKNQNGILSRDQYSEKINDFFKMTYSNYDFVEFKVDSVKILMPDYFQEFLSEFGY